MQINKKAACLVAFTALVAGLCGCTPKAEEAPASSAPAPNRNQTGGTTQIPGSVTPGGAGAAPATAPEAPTAQKRGGGAADLSQ